MAGRKRKLGTSKPVRSEVVTVRLDPRLKYGADLAARKQRRPLSGFIEWSVEEALKRVSLRTDDYHETTAMEAMAATWDVEEADRFVNLAISYPELLTFEEEQIWKLIRETPRFWKGSNIPQMDPLLLRENILLDQLRPQWDNLHEIIQGNLPRDVLKKQSGGSS